MLVSRYARAARALPSLARQFSGAAATPLTSLTPSATPGVSVLKLEQPPVNVLSRPMMLSLIDNLKAAEADPAVKALVLTSSGSSVFSAGLQITALYQPEPAALRDYFATMQDLFLTLYPFKKPVIAAMNGASPAGGCWLGLLSDYRILSSDPKAVIGLNETLLGVVAPVYFMQPFVACIGQRQAELHLQLGSLLSGEAALKIGLVDELASAAAPADGSGVSPLMAAALDKASKFGRIPAGARAQTKAELREASVSLVQANYSSLVDKFCAFVMQPGVQGALGAYLASLKARK